MGWGLGLVNAGHVAVEDPGLLRVLPEDAEHRLAVRMVERPPVLMECISSVLALKKGSAPNIRVKSPSPRLFTSEKRKKCYRELRFVLDLHKRPHLAPTRARISISDSRRVLDAARIASRPPSSPAHRP